jgi:hypothetical protein
MYASLVMVSRSEMASLALLRTFALPPCLDVVMEADVASTVFVGVRISNRQDGLYLKRRQQVSQLSFITVVMREILVAGSLPQVDESERFNLLTDPPCHVGPIAADILLDPAQKSEIEMAAGSQDPPNLGENHPQTIQGSVVDDVKGQQSIEDIGGKGKTAHVVLGQDREQPPLPKLCGAGSEPRRGDIAAHDP